MADFDWEADVRSWCHGQGGISFSLADRIVDFFRLSFENTRCPENAWFGCHTTSVSLVVGGIYLAAIQRTGKDRGVWFVVDENRPELSGVEYQPVLSTQGAQHPLVWGHSDSLQVTPDLVACASLWVSFSSATAEILRASRSAGARDEVQERRKKRRLSDFWSIQSVDIFPDEVASSETLWEGAVCRVSVNAYERSPEARRQCIAAHGNSCCICGFNFGAVYGKMAEGFIHVHQLRALSEVGGEYEVNPVEELRPVCPNCHAVLHLGGQCRKIEEIRQLLVQQANPGVADDRTKHGVFPGFKLLECDSVHEFGQ